VLNILFYWLILAYIGSVAVLSAIFWSLIEGFLLSLRLVVPVHYLDLVSPFIPSNLQACFSIVLSVRMILFALNWSLKFKDKLYQISVDSTGVK
jgi:hypothetical protein